MKNIGKPCAGNPHARFDEGEQASPSRVGLVRHRQTKGAETDRPDLRTDESCSLLYPFIYLFTQSIPRRSRVTIRIPRLNPMKAGFTAQADQTNVVLAGAWLINCIGETAH